jgi:hypothetical protein
MSSHEIFDVRKWAPVPLEEALAELSSRRKSREKEQDKGRPHVSTWRSDGRISQYDLYVYLKARFGPPNGLLMIGRLDSTDNLFQWHYTVRAGESVIEFMAGNSGLEVRVRSNTPISAEEVKQLPDAIKADFKHVGKELGKIRSELERWSIFINPFCRLDKIVNTLMEDYGRVDLHEPRPPPVTSSKRDADAYYASMREWIANLQRAAVVGASIRMLAPVLAESFVNLVIFVLAREDVKKDIRIYESLIRGHIDVRVRSLHLYCSGLQGAVNVDSEEFKAFHGLMNRRNDVLHGNVDPVRMKFEDVHFDGTIPLFHEEAPLPHLVIRNGIRDIEPKQALTDVAVVRGFIKLILATMVPDVRTQMIAIMREEQLGWRQDTGRVGILFGNVLAQAFVMVDDREVSEDEQAAPSDESEDSESEGANSFAPTKRRRAETTENERRGAALSAQESVGDAGVSAEKMEEQEAGTAGGRSQHDAAAKENASSIDPKQQR